MYEITKYYAEDGTEFEDEDECYEYEQLQLTEVHKANIVALDYEFDEISNYIKNFEDVYIFYIKTDEDCKWLREKLDDYGWNMLYFPTHKGIVFWDSKAEVWRTLESVKEFVSNVEKYMPKW